MRETAESKTNAAWKALNERHDIIEAIRRDGFYRIKASEIKEEREPRLMAKFDSSEQLPSFFKSNRINILPDSRSSYILGGFDLYEKLAPFETATEPGKHITVPSYESIDVNSITSEQNAINVMILSHMLDDFIGDGGEFVETFSSRMSSGGFCFYADRKDMDPLKIEVNNAQIEIDGGFENDKHVVIMEAKNVLHDDFHVRQLYYPLRKYSEIVRNKDIRLVFSQYYNRQYRLLEYGFDNLDDYNSIRLKRSRIYSLENDRITMQSILDICRRNAEKIKKSTIKTEAEDIAKNGGTFPQADRIERLIRIIETLMDGGLSCDELADVNEFDRRQSDYYYNAGKYLGLMEKKKTADGVMVTLTADGARLGRMSGTDRCRELADRITQHRAFNALASWKIRNSEAEDADYMAESCKIVGRECPDFTAATVKRRAATVRKWVDWVLALPQEY